MKDNHVSDPFARGKEEDQKPTADVGAKDDFAAESSKIKRGMPQKNLKVIGISVIVLLVIGFMSWPKGPKTGTTTKENTTKTDSVAAKSILDALNYEANQKVKPQDGVAPPAVTASSPVPSVDQAVGYPASMPPLPPLPTENQGRGAAPQRDSSGFSPGMGQKVDNEQARQESILASSMSPGDFKLTNGRDKNAAKSGDGAGQQMGLEEMIRQREERDRASVDGGRQAGRPDANRDFIQASSNRAIASPDSMHGAPPEFSLHQGTIVRGVLTNGINTQVPGEFRARVVSDVYDSRRMKEVLIPRGSTIIGAYKSSILVGQSRMVVAAQRLILPNGKSVNLRGSVLGDTQGVAGMPGEVDNHFWEMFKASAIIGAASLLLPKDKQTITTTVGGAGTQTGGSIVGTALSDVLTRIAQRNASIGPTGSVDTGEMFSLMIQRDLAMEPYKW